MMVEKTSRSMAQQLKQMEENRTRKEHVLNKIFLNVFIGRGDTEEGVAQTCESVGIG